MLNRYDEKLSPVIAFIIALGVHFLFFLILAMTPLRINSSSSRLKSVSFKVISEPMEKKKEQKRTEEKKVIAVKKEKVSEAVRKRKKKKVHILKMKEKVIDLRKVRKLHKIPPSSFTSKKKEIKSDEEKPLPVFGLSPRSVAGKGGVEGFRVGNTLMKEPEKKIVPPDKVKPYAGPPLTPIALVTKMPRFKKIVKPRYPERLRKMGIEGIVVLDVVVTSEGKATEIKVVKGDYPEFVSAAIEAIKHSSFYPAEIRGKPVNVKIRIPIKFRLVE